jgi:N-sulfoglucosamine sulfohydrolase
VAARLGEFFKARTGGNFFLMVNLFDPHRPFEGSFDMLKNGSRRPDQVKPLPFINIDGPDLRQHAAGFYNCVERLDYIFGKTLDHLDKEGLTSSTAVIFLGDHGPEFSRAKATCYEAGVRIPLMVRLPHGRTGYSTPKLASTIDLAPTVCELLGVEWGQGTGQFLARPEAMPDDRFIVTEFTAHTSEQYFPRRSIRDNRYKLCLNLLSGQRPPVGVDHAFKDIQTAIDKNDPSAAHFKAFLKTPKLELYDLKSDPWEQNDISHDPGNGVLIEHLRTELLAWQERSADPLLGRF